MGRLALWEREMQPADLPHDWLIYDTKNLYEDSIGWYRKKFVYSTSGTKCGKRVILRFEGVYMDSSIYINGVCLGDWKYGYSTFDWDITDHLREGENEVVLRVTFQAPNSRWYSGAGIYRNVWMICLPETHIPLDGIYTSSVETQKGYDLTIDTELKWGTDNGNYALEYCLYYTGDSKSSAETASREIFRVKQPLDGGQEKTSVTIPVDNPRKWDITDPYLYELQVCLWRDMLRENGSAETIGNSASQRTEQQPVQETNSRELCQEEHLRIGFRTMQFDPVRGFLLNGRKVRLNGACDHHDLGALGAAFHKEAMRRKFELMRSMGVNAVRTSHNMPAVELMELADEMGFLIVYRSVRYVGRWQRILMIMPDFSRNGWRRMYAAGSAETAIIPLLSCGVLAMRSRIPMRMLMVRRSPAGWSRRSESGTIAMWHRLPLAPIICPGKMPGNVRIS